LPFVIIIYISIYGYIHHKTYISEAKAITLVSSGAFATKNKMVCSGYLRKFNKKHQNILMKLSKILNKWSSLFIFLIPIPFIPFAKDFFINFVD